MGAVVFPVVFFGTCNSMVLLACKMVILGGAELVFLVPVISFSVVL